MPLTSATLSKNIRGFRIPRKMILRGLKLALGNSKKRVGISVVFVEHREMIRLHTRFLGLHSTTDVLTFELERSPKALQTEIYVCVDTARRQAVENRVSLRNELVRLCVHGALHAIGYDDHGAQKRAKMWRRQESVVRAAGA